MAIAMLTWMNSEFQPRWILGLVGGTFALVLKLVQVGYFFRLRGLPLWVVLGEDVICFSLVILAFRAPENGGIIAFFSAVVGGAGICRVLSLVPTKKCTVWQSLPMVIGLDGRLGMDAQ
jgi:hypothetical protein